MDDLHIRKDRRAGRITFARPQALNALSHDMALAIHAALDDWRDDDAVALVIIDAEGDRAFCAGGDIAAVYHAGRAGDHAIGQSFFADEYRMNAAINDYPKPIVAFMQGFVMGGGVGVGGHAGHRVVGDTTRIAMPESGIGLIPDVGGTLAAGARAGAHRGISGPDRRAHGGGRRDPRRVRGYLPARGGMGRGQGPAGRNRRRHDAARPDAAAPGAGRPGSDGIRRAHRGRHHRRAGTGGRRRCAGGAAPQLARCRWPRRWRWCARRGPTSGCRTR